MCIYLYKLYNIHRSYIEFISFFSSHWAPQAHPLAIVISSASEDVFPP